MVFRILDASAFYAGIPFRSKDECYTTSSVYDEIKHIKKNHDAIEILIETKRLKIMDPKKESIEKVIKMAKDTGDYNELSKEDISSISLCYELDGELITDDYAISNVSKNLGLKVNSVMTSGIRTVGKWQYYCPGCHKNYSEKTECPVCGSKLRKKLLKQKSTF